jgi:Rps23 Pro-64 3,4-dihydroxylase Tpa1-like proline 4-hydroxylase
MGFALTRALDPTALAAHFGEYGYVSIPNVLPEENARRIRKALTGFTDWNLVFNDRGKHIDLSSVQVHSMPPQAAQNLQSAVYAQASGDFQYLYHNYPIFDAHKMGRNRAHVLHKFYEWLDGEEFIAFARTVTGFSDISFVDAQATRFSPGHFLSTHDDSAQAKNRRAAYIFNFTEEWAPDWGGYLQLLDEDGHVKRGLRPRFNVLNIIAVPQSHNVSFVAPFAAAVRLSVTGWLRHGDATR